MSTDIFMPNEGHGLFIDFLSNFYHGKTMTHMVVTEIQKWGGGGGGDGRVTN